MDLATQSRSPARDLCVPTGRAMTPKHRGRILPALVSPGSGVPLLRANDFKDTKQYFSMHNIKEILQEVTQSVCLRLPEDPIKFMQEELSRFRDEGRQQQHLPFGKFQEKEVLRNGKGPRLGVSVLSARIEYRSVPLLQPSC